MARTRAEGPFSIELDAFPLVRLRSPSSQRFESVDVASFFACLDQAIARRMPFVLMHDARLLPYVDEQRQSCFFSLLARRRRYLARQLVAYAAITVTPFERGLITALAWSANLAIPTRLFATEADGEAFLRARYARLHSHARAALPLQG